MWRNFINMAASGISAYYYEVIEMHGPGPRD